MSEPTPISYTFIQSSVRAINQFLLQNEKGLLLRITVNNKNDVIDVDFVGTVKALENGLNIDGLLVKKK